MRLCMRMSPMVMFMFDVHNTVVLNTRVVQ